MCITLIKCTIPFTRINKDVQRCQEKTSFADLLFQAPSWVSITTAAITYLLTGHLLPSIETENQLINMAFEALAVPSPYFAIFILFIAPFWGVQTSLNVAIQSNKNVVFVRAYQLGTLALDAVRVAAYSYPSLSF